MSKDSIETLKRTYKDRIADKSTGNNTSMIIFNEDLLSDYCFARLFRRVRESSHSLKSFQFLLHFDRSSKIFDYNSLHKEMNKIFGEYFRIVRYFSGKKNVRILSFEPKKKFTHWKLWWISIYIASCMLRLTDLTFEKEWKRYFEQNKRKKSVGSWRELIYIFHRYVYSTNKGYELNQDIANLALQARGKKGGEDEVKERVNYYVTVLYTVFGKKFAVTKPMIAYLARWELQYQYQTESFKRIKHIKELADG